MEQILENFHFLRPHWLWALAPLAILTVLFWNSRVRGVGSAWGRYIDAHLLTHLSVTGSRQKQRRVIPFVAFIASALVVLGLAGPTWQESEVPSFTGGEPVVAVLSLAQSMNADDLTPSRLKRSVHKLRDILSRTEGDERGLVIYSDVPFVAAPLTNDLRVIEQMLPELSTSLMPVLGNRLDLAIGEARQVLERADALRGQIIVIADNAGSEAGASLSAAEAARNAGYEVSVLAVGTEEGATLQTADGRAISTRDGQTFMTKLSKNELMDLSRAGGGRFSVITPDDTDLATLLPATDQTMHTAGKADDLNADGWVDMGYWLLIIPVLLAPFVFRRGMIMGLVVVTAGLMAQQQPATARVWDDLWATKNQQAQDAFRDGDFASAAGTFEIPDWQAGAAYRAGDFDTAAAAYTRAEHPDADYNLGNALAWAGDLEGALAALDRALEANPTDADAQFNRDLIAKLLEQQNQEQNEQNSDDQQQEQADNQQGEQDQQQQQESESQQSQYQQSEDQQSQDQQGESGQQDSQSESGESSGDPQSAEDGSQGQQPTEPSGSDPASENAGADQAEGSDGEQQSEQANSGGNEAGSDGETERQEGSTEPASPQDAGAQDQPQQTAGPEQADTDSDGKGQTSRQMADQLSQDGLQQDDPPATQATEDTTPTPGAQEDDQAGASPLSRLFSKALAGNGEEQQPEAATSAGLAPVNQAVEQQLRRVPDDPSGLLRARIHQHYARMNATQ